MMKLARGVMSSGISSNDPSIKGINFEFFFSGRPLIARVADVRISFASWRGSPLTISFASFAWFHISALFASSSTMGIYTFSCLSSNFVPNFVEPPVISPCTMLISSSIFALRTWICVNVSSTAIPACHHALLKFLDSQRRRPAVRSGPRAILLAHELVQLKARVLQPQ